MARSAALAALGFSSFICKTASLIEQVCRLRRHKKPGDLMPALQLESAVELRMGPGKFHRQHQAERWEAKCERSRALTG